MVLESLPEPVAQLLASLSLTEALSVLEPLVIFVVGMVVYSVFVFKFYKFISRRDIFRISKGGESSLSKKVAYSLEYIFLFPLIAFFWFFVIAAILSMLSEVLSIGNVFMISMAIMATVRISAYHTEDLSSDIAKLIPFALLAVFLLDISSLSYTVPLEVVYQIVGVADVLIYYFGFILVLELLLRLIFHKKVTRTPTNLNPSSNK